MNRADTLSGLAVPTSSFRVAQWRMLLAAMLCYLFFYTGRQTFGFAIPGIQAEFGFTKETLGWASAAMLWAYAIGQAINGNLADKFGGRRIMSLGAVLSCGANWVTSFAGGLASLILPWGINGYFKHWAGRRVAACSRTGGAPANAARSMASMYSPPAVHRYCLTSPRSLSWRSSSSSGGGSSVCPFC